MLPASQSWQGDAASGSLSRSLLPAGQRVQTPSPSVSQPAPQSAHPPEAADVPGSELSPPSSLVQSTHTVAALSSSSTWPAAQSVQDVSPAAAYLPAAQSSQPRSAAPGISPAGHGFEGQ